MSLFLFWCFLSFWRCRKLLHLSREAPTIQTVIARQQQLCYAQDANLLAVPHDVLQLNLLSYLDARTLFQVLFVCRYFGCFCSCGALIQALGPARYVHTDALALLRRLSREMFGEHGTPLALSAKLYYELRQDCTTLARRLGVNIQDIRRDVQRSFYRLSNAEVAVSLCIARYGSVEGLYADRARKAELAARRQEERAIMLQGAQPRLQGVNALLVSRGFPAMLELSEDEVQWTPDQTYFDLFVGPVAKTLAKTIAKHIVRKDPSTTRKIAKLLPSPSQESDRLFRCSTFQERLIWQVCHTPWVVSGCLHYISLS